MLRRSFVIFVCLEETTVSFSRFTHAALLCWGYNDVMQNVLDCVSGQLRGWVLGERNVIFGSSSAGTTISMESCRPLPPSHGLKYFRGHAPRALSHRPRQLDPPPETPPVTTPPWSAAQQPIIARDGAHGRPLSVLRRVQRRQGVCGDGARGLGGG